MGDIDYTYSLPYVLIIIILLLLYGQEQLLLKRSKDLRKVSVLSFSILLIFIGLRGFLYTDFVNYYVAFDSVPKLYDLNIADLKNSVSEVGFFIWEAFFKCFTDDYHIWVFFNSLIDLFLIRNIFKKYTSSCVLPFVFFIAYWGLQFEFNLMRNIKGLLFFLLSLKYVEKRDFKRYLILNFCGCLFHVSSIVYIIVYPLLRVKWNRKVLIIIFFVINLLYLSGIYIGTISANLVLNYLGVGSAEKILAYISDASEMGITFGYLERVLSFLLFILYLDKIRTINASADMFISCALIYFSMYNLFSDIAIFVQRFPLLFIIGNWVLLSNLFQIEFRLKKPILFMFICLAITRTILSNSIIISKYDNILWGIESYESRRDDVYKFMKN